MNQCQQCHRQIDWDDDRCPHCGADHAHSDVEKMDVENKCLRGGLILRALGYSILVLAAILGSVGIGPLWGIVIIWVILGGIAWLLFGRSARANRSRTSRR